VSTVTGTLDIAGNPTIVNAPCKIRVRDITYSDAPDSQPIAEKVQPISVTPAGAAPQFTIDVPDDALAKVGRGEMALNLEVHIDVDNDGVFSAGDWISLQAQPIGPASPGAPITVPVVPV
jgi:hypothetical protein